MGQNLASLQKLCVRRHPSLCEFKSGGCARQANLTGSGNRGLQCAVRQQGWPVTDQGLSFRMTKKAQSFVCVYV